jgi:hypothetical protein
MIPASQAGQMAAVIISAAAVDDDARAIQALMRHGFRATDVLRDLDEAMALAREWSRPIERAAVDRVIDRRAA